MKNRLLPYLLLLIGVSSPVHAAITITIAPNGLGGTTYTFSQTSANPVIPVAMALSSGVRMDLPPGMFDPIVSGGPSSSDTSGTFEMIASFRDAGSTFTYDVTNLSISNVLAYASFGFNRPFAQAPGQTTVRFDLLSGAPGVLEISPDALVEGTYSIGSPLFGTVTVNVIPEPTSVALILPGALLLTRRQRHTRRQHQ